MHAGTWFDEAGYLEGPRFHRGQLYCASTLAQSVLRFDASGARSLVCEIRGVPCGLGFLPDGDLIILEMLARKLWRWSAAGLTLYADLTTCAAGTIDDMFIDAEGRAYVGDLGFDLFNSPVPPAPVGRLLLVPAGGKPRVVAEGLGFPNGICMTSARDRLAVAESNADSIAWFDVSHTGELSLRARRAGFAEPDGICFAGDRLWVAQFRGDSFVCVDEAGTRHASIETPGRRAVACWASADQRTLFCISADTTHDDLMHGRSRSRLETKPIA